MATLQAQKVTLKLIEIDTLTGIPTGRFKNNVSTDINYIPPSTDNVSCPIIIQPSPDITPDAFAFTAIANSEKNILNVSEIRQITGINAPTIVKVGPGAEYKINNLSWTSQQGTINNLDNLQVRAVSSSLFSVELTFQVTVGSYVTNFVIANRSAQNISASWLIQRDINPFVWVGFYLSLNGVEIFRPDYEGSGNIPNLKEGDVIRIYQYHNLNFTWPTDAKATLIVNDGTVNIFNQIVGNPSLSNIQDSGNITLGFGKNYSISCTSNSSDFTLIKKSLEVKNSGFYSSNNAKISILDNTNSQEMIYVNNSGDSASKLYDYNVKSDSQLMTVNVENLISGQVRVRLFGIGLEESHLVNFGTKLFINVPKIDLLVELMPLQATPQLQNLYLTSSYIQPVEGEDKSKPSVLFQVFTGQTGQGVLADAASTINFNYTVYTSNGIQQLTAYIPAGMNFARRIIYLDINEFVTDVVINNLSPSQDAFFIYNVDNTL